MDLENKQVSVLVAHKIAEILKTKGMPSPGKLLIISPTGDQLTKGGILIPGTANEKDLPRKGVLIQVNKPDLFSEDQLKVGIVVTYGMYAGKEIQFEKEVYDQVNLSQDQYKFTVLSESEVVYIETNN